MILIQETDALSLLASAMTAYALLLAYAQKNPTVDLAMAEEDMDPLDDPYDLLLDKPTSALFEKAFDSHANPDGLPVTKLIPCLSDFFQSYGMDAKAIAGILDPYRSDPNRLCMAIMTVVNSEAYQAKADLFGKDQ